MVKVGFSTQKRNWISKFIRWMTGSKASHAWLLVENSFLGEDMVLEATEGGFRITTFGYFKATHDIVEVITPREPLDAGVRRAAKWLGRAGYDYTGLFGAFFVQLGKWLKIKVKNPLDDSDALFCSEAVVYVMQASNYPGANLLDPSSTTPQDLLNFFFVETMKVSKLGAKKRGAEAPLSRYVPAW